MLDALRRAAYVEVPMLADRELTKRFRRFMAICEFVASASVDASEIHSAVAEAATYADHLHACLTAHIDGLPLPMAPVLAITAKAEDRDVVIASATKPGQVITRSKAMCSAHSSPVCVATFRMPAKAPAQARQHRDTFAYHLADRVRRQVRAVTEVELPVRWWP